MTELAIKRCAVYCRVSSDEGLDQQFNSIDAQREAGLAFVMSQRTEGWVPVQDTYEDPGFSGGNMERPGFKRLMLDIKAGKVDMVVVYKIDRLSRSLADFAQMMKVFDQHTVIQPQFTGVVGQSLQRASRSLERADQPANGQVSRQYQSKFSYFKSTPRPISVSLRSHQP